MLHPLPKNVFSSRLVSTLAITTHPPRCCVDHARLVADKLANGKEPKEARRGCAIAIAIASAQPPEQLEVLHAGLVDARRRLAAGLTTSQHDTLTVENILLAVDHHEALIPILGQGCAGGRFCAVAPAASYARGA